MVKYSAKLPGIQENTPNADVVVKIFKAGEEITAGNVVVWATIGDGATLGDGLTVMQSDVNQVGVGQALETVATVGNPIRVQIYGVNQVALTTGGSAANTGTVLFAGAAGATAEAEVSAITAPQLAAMVGIALDADTDTTLAAGKAMICGMGSRP